MLNLVAMKVEEEISNYQSKLDIVNPNFKFSKSLELSASPCGIQIGII